AKENIKKRLEKFLRNLTKRFDAAIERLRKLASRIESRISKMETQGINTAEAKGLLDVAKVKINLAASSTEALKLKTNALLATTTASSTDLKIAFKNLKDDVKEVKDDVKAAHAALVDVINSLKPGRNKPKNATTTPATTTATTTDEDDD
ncbi:MAG: hypothetical protein AAB863_00815, partial [Patescibacteria group bacterium]